MNRNIQVIKENYLQIAKYAISLIEDNDTVYMTAASVGYFMAQHIPEKVKILAVVNSIEIAELLRPLDNVRVIMLGGEMDSKGMCRDSFAVEMLERLRFDKAFITAAAISPEFGLSIQNSINLKYLNTIMKQAKQVIGLFPVEKMGIESVVSICPADKLDILVTDWHVTEEQKQKYEEMGVAVKTVKEKENDNLKK